MANELSGFLTYAGMLLDGNPITNLMSIGGKSPRTGRDPPPPAVVGGLGAPGFFEGQLSGSL